MELTQDILNNIFTYKDGELYWKTKINRQTKVGTRAGSISGSGYWQTWVYNKKYLNHRLIFMMFNNSVPDCLDHIDRNPLNNKIENLRSATRTENQYNKKTFNDISLNRNEQKNFEVHPIKQCNFAKFIIKNFRN